MDSAFVDAAQRVLGERPRSVTPMAGATSSELYQVELAHREGVLRLFIAERWDATPEVLSARELAILRALEPSALPTPAPLGRLPGNGVIMSLLPGRVLLPEPPDETWLRKLAETLARIHRLRIQVPYRYESWNDTQPSDLPAWWQDADTWHLAQTIASSPPSFEPVFIHRDYHPVNVLWEGNEISGIVDWVNACLGPAGVDVAHCRSNLSLMYGEKAAAGFLAAYQTAAPGYVHDAYWDIDDALSALPDVAPYPPWAEFGLTGLTTEVMRKRLEAFVRAAVAARTGAAASP